MLYVKMSHMNSEYKELQVAIEIATETAVKELFNSTNENFYYCCLITSGEAHSPILSAWSVEALEEIFKNDPEAGALKWSYADSPYCFFGETHFTPVQQLFLSRPSLDSSKTEFHTRITAMENALKELDSKGLFGKGTNRNKIYINVEVVPPDYTNTERARRLNPPAAIKLWLQEAAV